MTTFMATPVNILCCLCGLPTPPNASNTCASCLSQSSDITRGITTEVTLHQCRSCQRWHKEENKWLGCDLESRELMGLCLEKTAGLKPKRGTPEEHRVKLTDASWIWTEPHSMRLKVKLTVQKQVDSGLILQQSFVVEYVVRNQQCPGCLANFTQGAWKHLVQVRQKVGHKRTFLYLEQVILKKNGSKGALSIEVFRDGMDFYFAERGKGERFIDFLENEVPVRVKKSKKLIGTDVKSNISNYKFTSYVEIIPLCREDLLYLPKSLAKSQANMARCVLVKHVGEVVQIVDPTSGQTGVITSTSYWRDAFRPAISSDRSRLTRYVVMDSVPVVEREKVKGRKQTRKQRNRVSEMQLMKEDDMGVSDDQITVRSHIGYLCKAGDVVLGYNLADANIVEGEEEGMEEMSNAEVVVVRKLYGGVARGDKDAARQRIWRLQRLEVEVKETRNAKKEEEKAMEEEEDFMQELEGDRYMRENVNLYKRLDGMQKEGTANVEEDNDEDDQKITIDELLEGLDLDSGVDGDTEIGGGNGEGVELDEDQQWGGAFMGGIEEGARAEQDGIKYIGRDVNVKEKEEPKMVERFGEQFMNAQFKFT
mmetsp:Transcript_12054/g.24630  ORF Transcript_12054/g.24630 Transcript_12054/m.24630 type:complete len:593 (+) Transcript_12054:206-1984(+)